MIENMFIVGMFLGVIVVALPSLGYEYDNHPRNIIQSS